jgi:hypothetical protein
MQLLDTHTGLYEAEKRLEGLDMDGKIALLREYWVDLLDDVVDELIHDIPEDRRHEVYEHDDYGMGEKI